MKTPLFAGLSGQDLNLDEAYQNNRNHARRRVAFRQEFLKRIGDGKKISKRALRKFVFEDHKLKDFQAAELMQVFTAFRKRRSYADMIRMVEESQDKDFTNAQIVRELYAIACNHTGRYNKALETGEVLISKNMVNGEIYGTFGKAWLKKYDVAMACLQANVIDGMNNKELEYIRKTYLENFPGDKKMLKVLKNAEFCLEQAKDNYEAGFFFAFEYYPGINTVYRMLELGDIEEAKQTARMVQMACLRDGARESLDYWRATTMLEAACIMGAEKQDIKATIDRVLQLDLEDWQFEALERSLERLRALLTGHAQEAEVFTFALNGLRRSYEAYEEGLAEENASRAQEMSSAIMKASFNYRGLASNFVGASFIPGNFKFGGQLPDHCLTRTDWQQFETLLETPLEKLMGQDARNYPLFLKDIDNVDDFLTVTDKIIRRAFGTDEDNLEDILSAGHSRYDERVSALLELSGIQNRFTAESHTNISVILALGLGDCRHHAQAKQLLFDVWQKKKMNACLSDAYRAVKRKDMSAYQQSLEAFHDIEAFELRTMDVEVQAPIKMNGLYSPIHDENGCFIAQEDGSMNNVEEHTMNVLLKRNAKGEISSLRFADSFYQNHYCWGSGEVSVSDLMLDENGKLIIPAKTIMAVDPVMKKPVLQPVQLKPTPYAGRRDETLSSETGRLLLLGMPIQEGFSLAEKLGQSRYQRMNVLDRVRRWYLSARHSLPSVMRQRTGERVFSPSEVK